MAYEMRDLSGSLFKNDKRESETHPNAKGSALIGGVEYWVSAWTKTTNSGDKWQSLSFKPKDAQSGSPRSAAPAHDTDLDDDVPF